MLVIYHANCMDGFTAAWVAKKVYPDAEFFPAHYGQSPPNMAGKDVLMVDFSYKRQVLLEHAVSAKRITILDHHESAEKELKGVDGGNIEVMFDLSKSGARITWEWFFPHEKAPWVVDYTEDRDLWKWALPYSLAINAYLELYPKEFQKWDIFETIPDPRVDPEIIKIGSGVLMYKKQLIDSHLRNARDGEIAGYKVKTVNATALFSEIAGELAVDMPFGVCWFKRQDGKYQFSLRSREGGIKVNDIAAKFGGGGHPAAAGFEVTELELRTLGSIKI